MHIHSHSTLWRRTAAWLTAAACLFVAAQAHAAPNITVTDLLGRKVTVPANPQRIANLGGSMRVMAYLQVTERAVGTEDIEKNYSAKHQSRPYRTAHPELARLPRIGPGGASVGRAKPDYEAILAVKPDIIFMTTPSRDLADETQKTMGLPVVVLNTSEEKGNYTANLYQSLRVMGKIVQREQRAEAVIRYIEDARADLRRRVQGIAPQSAYVGGVSYAGMHGINGSNKRYLPFDWAGANNLAKSFASTPVGHIKLDREALLKLNPDVLFIDSGGWPLIQDDMGKNPAFFRSLKAFQTGQVYRLFPYVSYYSNIDTALVDAYAVGKALYPAQFADIHLQCKADEIYTFMVGKPVYSSMQSSYGDLGAVVAAP
ncbi:MAG: ABC transporter substrate-binding protein [Brachymonas sp.]|nr:ABC transporter substrate-binding protein [Brachymonas sp.]